MKYLHNETICQWNEFDDITFACRGTTQQLCHGIVFIISSSTMYGHSLQNNLLLIKCTGCTDDYNFIQLIYQTQLSTCSEGN